MNKQTLGDYLKATNSIYFIGIGGISMSGLAELALKLGYKVSGSDSHCSHRTDHLEDIGITVFTQQSASNIQQIKPQLAVKTAAIPPSNPELIACHQAKIKVIERGEFLGWLTENYAKVYNIAGTHGKTTTTAMVATILLHSNKQPTVHIGAEMARFANNTIHFEPQSELFISEACEYADSFLNMRSSTAAILNIDIDHLDYFKNANNIVSSFVKFAQKIDPSGYLIHPYPDNSPFIQQFIEKLQFSNSTNLHLISFGLADGADYQATNISFNSNGYPEFDVLRPQKSPLHIELKIPGEHNILNALAAIAICDRQNITDHEYQLALADFKGAEGRFSVKGKFQGALVVADYAHHPTATKATIKASEKLHHRHIWVVYQPLTFNRVKDLFPQYVDALKNCEEVLLYEIFSDREQNTLGMSSKLLADAINEQGGRANLYQSFSDIKNRLTTIAGNDDIILFLGPEEIRSFADKLISTK